MYLQYNNNKKKIVKMDKEWKRKKGDEKVRDRC
jgi:hypothetical protein